MMKEKGEKFCEKFQLLSFHFFLIFRKINEEKWRKWDGRKRIRSKRIEMMTSWSRLE